MYRLLVWSSLGFGALFSTLGITAYSYYEYTQWKQAKQDQKDHQEYQNEINSLTTIQNVQEMQWNFGSGIFDRLSRFIALSIRLCYLGMLYVPLLFLFPLCSWNNFLYRNVWGNYLLICLKLSGPCFIKLGQWIGTRRDLFSDVLIEKCSLMHSTGVEHSFEETREIIEGIYHKTLNEIFSTFDPAPLASGSIAQIHKATLKDSPDDICVIKVRHPGVEYEIYRDLYILNQMASLLNWMVPSFHFVNLSEIFDKFSHDMYAQTNLIQEAQNLIKFKYNFKHYDEIQFPNVVTSLPLHPAVLIESFQPGIPLSKQLQHLDELNQTQKNKIAQLGTSLFLKMMLVDNFLHADLHPGNILINIVDGQPKLTVLDAGLVSTLSDRDKRNFLDLFSLIAEGDGIKAAEIMVKRSRNVDRLMNHPENIEMFTFEMSKLIGQVVDKPLAHLQVGNILGTVLDIGRKYGVVIESNFTTLVLGCIVLEGVAKTLNPDFEFIKTARPFLVKDKTVRDAFITSQLTKAIKHKNWSEKVMEWLDLIR